MAQDPQIQYSILPRDPHGHLYAVRCTVAQPDRAGQRFAMAAWIPGSYMIRDFAKNVVRVQARHGERELRLEKTDKQTWRCEPCDGPLVLEYDVYAWDLSVRGAHLDASHAYFNGTSVFMRVLGQEQVPCELLLQRPDGDAYRNWRVATSMRRSNAPEWGFGSYRAESYDELIDHPVEMGSFELGTFEVAGVPHHLVLYGRQHADMERLCRDLRRICEYHVGLFGELPQMDRYLFLTMVVGDGYGGLEHRASCSLLTSRDSLPRPGDDQIRDSYRDFLALCSHEYFHTWNVKRIKPAAFVPYELEREVHTRLLWAFEGITSYYDELALVRAGLISPESYLEMLSQAITRVLRTPGRFKQSVAESSFDAWTKFYKQDENAPNAIVSYYAKGSLIALALDLSIRRHTGGERSLDDVMRALWREYGKVDIGVPEEAMASLVSRVAGMDLSDTLYEWVEGTVDPQLEPLLADVGVRLHLRGADSAKDKGGKPSSRERPLVVLGVRLSGDGDAARLAVVFEDSPAARAGLSAGDELIAVDGLRINGRSLETVLQNYAVGSSVSIHAFRRDELFSAQVTLAAARADTAYMTIDDLSRCRTQWLGLDPAA